MLGPGPGAGEKQVEHLGRGLLLFDELVVLLLDPIHARARFGFRTLSHELENLPDVLDLLLGLCKVVLEALPQLGIVCLACELRERLDQQLLDVVDVSQLVNEELAGFGHRGHQRSSFSTVCGVGTHSPSSVIKSRGAVTMAAAAHATRTIRPWRAARGGGRQGGARERPPMPTGGRTSPPTRLWTLPSPSRGGPRRGSPR